MSSPRSARGPHLRRARSAVVAVAIGLAAVVFAAVGHESRADPSPASALTSLVGSSSLLATSPVGAAPVLRPPQQVRPGGQGGPTGEADGVVEDDVRIDEDVPAVANLDPALLEAARQAAAEAADDGIELVVNSGWRSPEYQEQLLREAISKYGSREEAARWVATPETSAHVSGDAVDIGHRDGASWLADHGAVYGLCRIYDNEPWHFELRPDAAARGCPPTYDDPTQDPRMQP